MEQLLLHLFGDYFLQTDKQAVNKKKNSIQCLLHCIIYSLGFLLITNIISVFIIGITHFIIDRTNVIANIIAFKNNTRDLDGKLDISNFGFHKDRPFALSIWLMIITDNTFHLIINYLVIKYVVL